MDTIQCEKKADEYLIWKWRPNASAGPGQSRKENTIRSGSSLIVKDGQAAIFQYPQGGYDIFIDEQSTRLSTDNLPPGWWAPFSPGAAPSRPRCTS